MNIENKSKWQLRFATLSIFLLGFIAGAFALNAYHLWFGESQRQTRFQKYEALYRQLDLTESQKAEIEKIVNETRENVQKMRQESEPRMQEIRVQHDEKLQKVLTPEQWQKFQQEEKDAAPKPFSLR
jgi:Spy/CpxP family protein refolding chaperone